MIKMPREFTLKELQKRIMQQAKEKGFGTKPAEIIVAEKIALIHAEIAEAFEAYRKKNMNGKDGFKEELGDALQRILHLCGVFNFTSKGIAWMVPTPVCHFAPAELEAVIDDLMVEAQLAYHGLAPEEALSVYQPAD